MTCFLNFNISANKAFADLRKDCGTNVSQFYRYLSAVISPNSSSDILEFTEEFKTWWTDVADLKSELNAKTTNPKLLKDNIKKYFESTANTFEGGIRKSKEVSKVVVFGYNSVATREFGKRLFANHMLTVYNELKNVSHQEAKNITATCASKTITFFKNVLANKLAKYKGLNGKEVFAKLGNNSGAYINSLIDDDAPQQLKNLAALYKEITTTPLDESDKVNFIQEYVNEVLNDSRLGNLRQRKEISEFEAQENKAAQEQFIDDDELYVEDSTLESNYDVSIRVYNEHGGHYTDYIAHLDEEVKVFLSSIRKLNDWNHATNSAELNLDNEFGVPDVHNASELATIIYHYGNFEDVQSMIQSFKDLAKTLPEYAAFMTIATTLDSNSDLAFAFYRTFAKAIISKIETIVSNGNTSTRISNLTSSRLEVLRFDFINNLKSTAIKLDLNFAKAEYKFLNTTVNSLSETNDNGINEAIVDLFKQLVVFYPSLSEHTIRKYVNGNKIKGVVNRKNNLKKLMKILSNTIERSNNITEKYNKLQTDRYRAWAKNKRLERENVENPGSHSVNEFENIEPLYYQSYISKEDESPCLALANELLEYAVVRTNLNSRNVHGNQSSDVINNSMITNLMKIFESVLNKSDDFGNIPENSPLVQFAKHRFQSQQYDNSNILLEKTEDGKVVNYGLFRKKEDGTIVPTSYARQLLHFSLFNGASNIDDGTNVLYNQMSRGDYIGTAWINFFSEEIIDEYSTKIQGAKYFLRIPSDAPKTFTLTAPKYSTKDFRILVNRDEINNAVVDFVKNITAKTFVGTALYASNPLTGNKKDITWTNDELLKHLKLDGSTNLNLPFIVKNNRRLNDDDKLSLTFGYIDAEDAITRYVITGTYKDGKLVNAKFDGFIDEPSSEFITELRSAIFANIETTGEINGIKEVYKVNSKHALYKQLRAAFVQELTDAAVALDVMFDLKYDEATQTYFVGRRKDDSLAFKNNYDKNTGPLIKVYHFNKSVVTGEKGQEKLTGRVFTSDKFTIWIDDIKDSRNFGQEIIDEAIDFLYKGDKAKLFRFKKDETTGKVTPVIDHLESLIEEKINAFVDSYVAYAREQLTPINNFLKGTSVTTDNITSFAMNYHLMQINFNDLLEGDTKFYKDAQTFLKRAKEYQGSGTAYGIANFTQGIDNLISRSNIPSVLDKTELGIKLKNTFTAVTIKNSIKNNEESLKRLRKQLVDNKVLNENDADTLLYGPLKNGKRTGGFQNTTVNDAQSYITFEEWVRRIVAKGQYYKYKDLIEKIIDPNSTISAADMKAFVQVQKNFYYDLHYNKDTKTIAPRQIKNAEFVLVERFIKGTELEQVYNLMKKYNIDQLNTEETSKAAKSYVLEIFDEETGLLLEDIKEELNGGNTSKFGLVIDDAKEEFDYNYLYTQQETPQHLNDENKAGIQIMKKILDNIDENSSLYPLKTRFFELYSANIKEAFTNLAKEFNIPLDKNGHIVLKRGVIDGLNYELFYKRLEDELIRLGLDSNMKDYVTVTNDKGGTVMPNYMSLVSSKLENIAQSLFNNNITRQTLPGFHAVQVTGVGFSSIVENKAYSDRLRFHPEVDGKVQPYIEIMLPAAAFGFDINSKHSQEFIENQMKNGKTKEEAIRALKDLWLSQIHSDKMGNIGTIIGYRIPTEGKQSVCIMKVVDFVDDALGSTIVLPDEWVSQTGADFDIDSVYGIMYKTYIDENGNIKKVLFENSKEKLYLNYVRKNIGKERWNEAFENSRLEEDEKKELIKKYTNSEGKVDWTQYIAALKNKSREYFIEDLNAAISHAGLMSFTEFSQKSEVELNSKDARDNEILDIMIKILSDISSLEENLSRSNFDDVRDALDLCLTNMPEYRRKRNKRSPYNFFDQADFQEDAMSGAKLKAFSVTRDTFCSVCNSMKTTVSSNSAINVVYDFSNLTKEEFKAKLESLNNSFETVKDLGKQQVSIKHNKIGWSLNNKNVAGKILTSYSSQTTAHILDAIKAGAVPNVNDLTFAVYKTFVDMGSDYTTAISFMMQPGVKRIVEAYNASKSIYADNNSKAYVNQAIRQIAKELKIDVSSIKKIDDVILAINSKYGSFINKTFGTKRMMFTLEEDKLVDIPHNVKLQLARLSGEDVFYETSPVEGIDAHTASLLFDLVIVLQYNKISSLAKEIGDTARVSNPDRFGAKQSIFATNDIFDQIAELAENETPKLLVNGKHFIKALYPGAEKGVEAFIKQDDNKVKSLYPPLYNFLKFATATSVIVNRQLFVTQNKDFIDFVKRIENKFSDNNKLDEKTYKDFQNYIIASLYKKTSFINSPLGFSLETGRLRGFTYKNNLSEEPNVSEYARIFGYGHAPKVSVPYEEDVYTYDELGNIKSTKKVIHDVPFVVENIKEPTEDEIRAFCQLSPAQKVLWIQENYVTTGIFQYIKANLHIDYKYRGNKAGSQTIEFIEDAIDNETAYQLFYDTFTNKDPFLAIAAADVIKYAFVVEGYKMGMRNVSKVISNKALISTSRIFGTNIVNELNFMINHVNEYLTDDLYHNFIRSHSKISAINRRTVERHGKGFELRQIANNLIVIPNDENQDALTEKYGITYKVNGETHINEYVNLKFKDKTVLYKISHRSGLGYILTPINLLEANENADWSANDANHMHLDEKYYLKVIEDYEEAAASKNITAYSQSVLTEVAKEIDTVEYKAPKVIRKKERYGKAFRVDKDDQLGKILIHNVKEWYPNHTEQAKRYLINNQLGDYIIGFGPEHAITTSVPVKRINESGEETYEVIDVIITKEKVKNEMRTYVKDKGALNREIPSKIPNRKEKVQLVELLRNFAKGKESSMLANLDNVYSIQISEIPADPGSAISFSTISDVANTGMGGVHSNIRRDEDISGRKLVEKWRSEGVTKEKVKRGEHVNDVIIDLAKYVTDRAKEINKSLEYFIEDPNNSNSYLSITHPETIKLVKKDPLTRKRFLKTIMEPQLFIQQFGLIKELDIKSQDSRTQIYLNKILEAVTSVENDSVLSKAKELYISEYIDKISDSPLMRRGLISVVSGFYKTNWVNSLFSDIQHAPNPLVQTTLKDVMNDIRHKELEARRAADKFTAAVKAIEEKAKAAGKPINYANIINEYGEYVKDFNSKFIEDRDRLQREANDAKTIAIGIGLEKGYSSNEYIKAYLDYLRKRLVYNEWKAKHLEQPVVKEYYDKVNALERKILIGKEDIDEETGRPIRTGASPYIYVIYETLRKEASNIRNVMLDDVEDVELDRRLDDIQLSMFNLTSEYITEDDGYTNVPKIEYTSDPRNEDEAIARARLSKTAARRLNDYLTERKIIENTYWMYDPVYNFEEEVKRNQAIIDAAEQRDANDIPQVSVTELENNAEYKRAKLWLKRNAYRRPLITEEDEWYEEVNRAFEILSEDKSGFNADYARIIRKKEYRDHYGQLDPRLMSKEDLLKLKEYQEKNYKIKKENPYSDRNLLSSKSKDKGIIYTSAFYKQLTGAGEKSTDNIEWQKIITDINDILANYYSETSGTILFNKILNEPNAKEILTNLKELYDKLDDYKNDKKKGDSKTKRKNIYRFIKANVSFVSNKTALEADELLLTRKSELSDLLRSIMYEVIEEEDGSFVKVPNRYIYQSLELKLEDSTSLDKYLKGEPVINKKDRERLKKYVDRDKTNAIKNIQKYTYQRPSSYYYAAEADARSGKNLQGFANYKEWFAANHIYNPNSNRYEPIKVWMVTDYKESLSHIWTPKFPQTIRKVRDGRKGITGYGAIEDYELEEANEYNPEYDFVNKNYTEGGHELNYVKGSNTEYDNNTNPSEYELELRKLMLDTTISLAYDDTSRKWLNKRLPSKQGSEENSVDKWKKEMLKFFGWTSTYTGKEEYDSVDYTKDKLPGMPSLALLKNKYITDKEKELGDRPRRGEYETDEAYINAKNKWDEEYKAFREEEKKIHKQLSEGNPVNAIADFIVKAGHYNAVQDNKYQLYFAQQALRKYGVYQRKYKIAGNLQMSGKDAEGNKEYVKTIDEDMAKQFDVAIRRIIYDQWKEPAGNLTKYGSILQSFTSAKYMIFNIKGYIANLTIGESQIMAEVLAREQFNVKDWGEGKAAYIGALYDYIANIYNETSYTKQGAIIKLFDIIDYDEHNGIGHVATDSAEILKRIRNFGYSGQTATEHFMQNSVLLTMLKSHRLVPNERAEEFGQPPVKFVNFSEFIRDKREAALKQLLGEDSARWKQYQQLIDNISSDANDMKEYAWFRKDFIKEFMSNLTIEERKQFNQIQKNLTKDAKKEFNSLPDLYSQLELGKDGKYAFAAGSDLAKYDIKDEVHPISDALKVIANFKGRVIAVNKLIHGSYDKHGRAAIEQNWIGGLIMQYHKHLPNALMKRYRVRGYFNEDRGAVEKGSYASLMDFLAIPFERHQAWLELNDREVWTLKGVQNLFKEIINFFAHPILEFTEMADYDKANVRRASNDILGVLGALMLVIAIKAAGDDDKDSVWYNLALYEADRFATESGQYTPVFLPVEGKKIWANPIAGFNSINDVFTSMQMIAQYILDPEFDPIYRTGRRAGENKFQVRLENNIPGWRGIKSSFIDITENNKAYKVGQNILTMTDVN